MPGCQARKRIGQLDSSRPLDKRREVYGGNAEVEFWKTKRKTGEWKVIEIYFRIPHPRIATSIFRGTSTLRVAAGLPRAVADEYELTYTRTRIFKFKPWKQKTQLGCIRTYNLTETVKIGYSPALYVYVSGTDWLLSTRCHGGAKLALNFRTDIVYSVRVTTQSYLLSVS